MKNAIRTDYNRMVIAKAPSGFIISYRFESGKTVAASYDAKAKIADFFIDKDHVATLGLNRYDSVGKAYRIVRLAFNGFLSLAGKKNRLAANKAKRKELGGEDYED